METPKGAERNSGFESLTFDALAKLAIGAKTKHVRRKRVNAISRRAPKSVLDLAEHLCASRYRSRRRLGAELVAAASQHSPLVAKKASTLLCKLIDEHRDAEELRTILGAVSNWGVTMFATSPQRIIRRVRSHAFHTNWRIRLQVAQLLGTATDPPSQATLVQLSTDRSAQVRNWATFALGELSEQSSPPILEALANRLQDTDWETRQEAINGLLKRGDPRGVSALLYDLQHGTPSSLLFETAAAQGCVPCLPMLRKLLQDSRKSTSTDREWLSSLEYAVRSLTRIERERVGKNCPPSS